MPDTSTGQTALAFGPRDPRYEAKFAEWNLDYRFEPAFPVDGIKIADWAQVRQKAHIAPEDEAEEYRQHMANGAMFPPILIMAPETLIDGNTRLKATKKLHKKTIAAYIIDIASVPMAKSLAGAINNMGGKRLSAEEAADAAKTMMSMDFTDEAIAREIGRSVEQVRRIRNQIEFAERSERLNLKTEQVTQDNRARLNSIKHDPPFAEFVNFVAEIEPPKKVVSDLLRKVQEAPSDSDAITAIHDARKELRPAGPPPRRASVTPSVQQASMHLAGLLKYVNEPTAIYDTREDKRDERIGQWQQLHELTGKMLELYGVGERQLVTA